MTSNTEKRCLVRGSINVDEYLSVEHIVIPGETIGSETSGYARRIGGKGANGAVAIALAGGKVEFSGLIGNDASWLSDTLKGYGVGVEELRQTNELPTGRAFIQVDRTTGENAIVLLHGANHPPSFPLSEDHLKQKGYTHLLVQNEIPWEHTMQILKTAKTGGPGTEGTLTTIFNPSPLPTEEQMGTFDDPDEPPKFPWHTVDFLVLNSSEAEDLIYLLVGSRDNAPYRPDEDDYQDEIEANGENYWEEIGMYGEDRVGTEVPEPGGKGGIKRIIEADYEVMQGLSRGEVARMGIVITLGKRGCLVGLPPQPRLEKIREGGKVRDEEIRTVDEMRKEGDGWEIWHVPPGTVEGRVKDSTGAGDCLTGYFTSLLLRLPPLPTTNPFATSPYSNPYKQHIHQIMKISNQAAAMCVERDGTADSYPKLAEVRERMEKLVDNGSGESTWPEWL